MAQRLRIAVAAALGCALAAGCGADARTDALDVHGAYRVAGRRMYLRCEGRGRPVVVLDAGLGVPSATAWDGVMRRVSRFAAVCRYDRGGLGLSDPAPPPRTAGRMVGELRALLRAAHVPGPYVLVGASFGGLNAQLFAREAPADMRGIVLVDSIHADLDRRIDAILPAAEARARRAALARNAEGVRFRDILASDRELRDAPPFPPIPLIALRHGVSFDPGGRPDPRIERLWSALQRDLARQTPAGSVRTVPGTHHRIAEERPDAVAAAVREVLRAARRPPPGSK